jgi:hypothetical protein
VKLKAAKRACPPQRDVQLRKHLAELTHKVSSVQG